jgi:hypothetical protein
MLVVLDILAGVGQHEFSQLHSPQSQHMIRELLQVFAFALHDHHFQTVVMIEVNVGGGQHARAGGVLRFGQLLRKVRRVVVIYQGQGADHRLVGVHRLG